MCACIKRAENRIIGRGIERAEEVNSSRYAGSAGEQCRTMYLAIVSAPFPLRVSVCAAVCESVCV